MLLAIVLLTRAFGKATLLHRRCLLQDTTPVVAYTFHNFLN